MPTQWKSITVFLDGTDAGEWIGRQAAHVAARHRSHLVGVHGLARAASDSTAFARGEDAIQEAIGQLREQNEQALLHAGGRLRRIAGDFGISAEFRVLWKDQVSDDALFHSLHTDLVILPASAAELSPGWSPERLVLDAGVPVLLVPDGWPAGPVGTRVLLAWNGSRQARRAIVDALPFLAAAEQATVLIVDADQHPQAHGEEPGADIARYLARHEVRVEVLHAASAHGDVAAAIARAAEALASDLIVIGAYSHSRRAELIFGGVTRTLLKHSPIPLFVSR